MEHSCTTTQTFFQLVGGTVAGFAPLWIPFLGNYIVSVLGYGT